MLSKINKMFFNCVFAILYISFFAQMVYVIAFTRNLDSIFIALGLMSFEWLALISARFLFKKSTSTVPFNNNRNNNNRNGAPRSNNGGNNPRR